MNDEVNEVSFSATDYPITVAEVLQASEMLDRLLSWEERDQLVDCLAYQPDVGEHLVGGSGVRFNVFEFGDGEACRDVTVVYLFHDLNMPLYVLAVYEGEKVFRPESDEEETVNNLAAGIVHNWIKGAKKRAASKT
ncbi:hypothetical protein AB1A64_13220 [Ruegeria sp. ANG10]|uniref:hypothetical protein n=1 Tax=Ruegeria sp. ANG10 TaxID=3042467 RepID=UPI003455EB0C